jgi:NADPH:quinone reductase-like Zn-dependent oxidoreductase
MLGLVCSRADGKNLDQVQAALDPPPPPPTPPPLGETLVGPIQAVGRGVPHRVKVHEVSAKIDEPRLDG